jgi:hypothetical protein
VFIEYQKARDLKESGLFLSFCFCSEVRNLTQKPILPGTILLLADNFSEFFKLPFFKIRLQLTQRVGKPVEIMLLI